MKTNQEDLKNIWNELVNENGDGEFYVIRTINIQPLEVRLKLEKPLNKYSILIISNNISFHSYDILTNNKYFKVTENSKDDKKSLIIELTDNVFVDEFILFSRIILDISKSAINASDAISIISKKIKQFEKFISSTSKKFTFEKRMGLSGELHFMDNFLFKNIGFEESIKSWKGPQNTSQDFIFNNCRFEIKSTPKENNTVKISSLSQLDPNERNLYLVRNHISENNTLGYTLDEIILSIDSKIKEISNELSLEFHSLIRQYGYATEEKNEHSNFKYIFSGRDYYEISDQFPSIHMNNKPDGVTHVNYDLDLNKCSDWAVNEIKVIQKVMKNV